MTSKYRRMSNSDIQLIVSDLDEWALGNLGSKLTWSLLEKRFQFSRQSLQSKPEIKAAYISAKKALSGGLVETKNELAIENKELLCEISRLKSELDIYKLKESNWMKRWQRIAFHVRQKGIQMSNVDKHFSDKDDIPSSTESAKILRLFDKEIPPSGRI